MLNQLSKVPGCHYLENRTGFTAGEAMLCPGAAGPQLSGTHTALHDPSRVRGRGWPIHPAWREPGQVQ